MPFFGYGNDIQPTKAELLAHLQSVKKETLILLNEAQSDNIITIEFLTKHYPKDLQNMKALVAKHFGTDITKKYLTTLTEYVFSIICNDMNSFIDTKSIDALIKTNIDVNPYTEKYQANLFSLTNNTTDENSFSWRFSLLHLEDVNLKMIICEVILEKIDHKIKQLESQA